LNPVDARCNLLEQLKPLASSRRLHDGEAGCVAARPRQAPHEAAADRIGNDDKNDGDGVSLLQHCSSRGRVLRKNDLGSESDEFLRGSLPDFRVLKCAPASVDLDIAAFSPPEPLEALPECSQVSLKFPVALGMRHQHANPPHSVRLLRIHRERPRAPRCTTDKRDEFASLHVPSIRTKRCEWQIIAGYDIAASEK
jgi:hypothetical protein